MLEYALDRARLIPYAQGQRRVYSVIVDRRGRVLAEGQNSYVKTHPLQAHYAEKVDLDDKVFLHAEVSALVKLRACDPHKIYIARVDSEGRPMLAAPCPVCNLAIKDHDINSVEYTV